MNDAKGMVKDFRANFVRVEGDYSTNKINDKIQHAEKAKVHTMLVIRSARYGGGSCFSPLARKRKCRREAEE